MGQGKTLKRIAALRQEQEHDYEMVQKIIRRMHHRSIKIKNIEKNRQLDKVKGYYTYSGHFIQEDSI